MHPLMRATREFTRKCDCRPREVTFRFAALWVQLALVIAACTTATAEPIAFKKVSIAGTFNDWNTGQGEFVLKPAGARQELVRSWDCGTYKFKFVFDGEWTRRWGEGPGGTLVQPGGDIKLTIPQSGSYALWLDAEAGKWGVERRAPQDPIARIVVQGAELSRASVLLDGRLSEASAGHKIEKYAWTIVNSKDSASLRAVTEDKARSVLYAEKPGTYRVRLMVNDGRPSQPAEALIDLGRGWDMLPNHSAGATRIPLLPMGDGIWGRAVQGPGRSFEPGFMRPFREQAVPAIQRPNDAPLPNDRVRLVQLDTNSNRVSFEDSGFREFKASPTDNRLPKDTVIERIDLLGEFNGWRPGATPMVSLMADPESYVACVPLSIGVHHYKFVVNGAIWLNDPAADPKLADADGNSGVRIGPDPAALGPVKPNDVIVAGLSHDPSSNSFFAPISDDTATVTLQTLAGDAQAVTVEFISNSAGAEMPGSLYSMTRVEGGDGFDYWKAQITEPIALWHYWFSVTDGTANVRFPATGAASGEDSAKQLFQGRFDMRFKTPDWSKTAVWYQIFPERFRNGDPANDPPRTVPWKHAWFKPYKGKSTGGAAFEEKGTFFQFIYDRRYGGDLAGVREKLGYLSELGVTAIYFNPMFEAESLHKYDASDYRHIDDFFGVKGSLKKLKGETEDPKTWQWSETDKLFLDFLKEAHRQGFRVVLDGVFNHVGRDFWAFRDVLKNGEKSKYAGWFDIVSFKPFHYKAWDKDDGTLPRLKHDDKLGLAEPVREHLFAVTRRWMDPNGDGDPSDGIDGWRLDVASDISVNFWGDWRKLVKKTNPDAYIVAELWQESRAWLDGKSFDAVMNYPFAVSAQKFFVNQKKATKPKAFMKDVKEMLGWYAPQVNHVLQNLFDSHDTDRLASMFLNPDLEYDKANRPQDNGPNYNTARPTADCYRKMKLAVTWQMTFLGAPMIYYGDEVGMFGADDPTDRKPMLWADLLPYDDADERIEPDVLQHYQRMIAIRNTYKALRLGSFDSLMEDDRRNVLAYARRLGNQTVLVVLNNSDTTRRIHMASPWPDGADLVRVDDPSQAELVTPEQSDAKGRPSVRPISGKGGSLRSDKGVLFGVVLEPRTGAVIVSVPKDKKDK